MRQIILDTETTGLSPKDGHRIIEIAGVELENRQLTGRHFHKYINPQRAIDIEAQKVHGITLEFLKDKPVFSEIIEEFIDFIKGAELVIHNAPFDVGFLNHEFNLSNRSVGSIQQHCQVFDTLELARQLHPGQRNNLDALCKRYTIDNSSRDLHGALIDADLLAMVYLAMTSGQDSLFIEVEKSVETAAITEITEQTEKVVSTDNFCVIKANSAELQFHDDMLDIMQKKSKNCVWVS